MKEPERLFAGDPDLARLQDLLERDGPPHGAIERATARVLAAGASDDAPEQTTLARPSASPAPWVIVGFGAAVLVASALAGSPWRQTSSGASPESLASTRPPPAAPTASSVADRASGPDDLDPRLAQPAIRVDDLPAAASRPATAASTAASADPFLEELALVERARAALARSRGRECLDATTAYEKRFAKAGLFREEVEVMHVEALAISGERATARARGQRFLATHRDTPYAERIRRVIDQAGE